MSAFLRRRLAIRRRKEVEIMLQMIQKCIRKLCPRPVSSARGEESDAAHIVRRAVRRYGETTARGEASSSTCAAMVRAWLRQRRIIPGNRSLTRRDQRIPAAFPAAAEFSGMVSTVSSEQAAYRSLPRQRESSLASLLLLFKSQPLRWVAI